jgi:hypothetical protein
VRSFLLDNLKHKERDGACENKRKSVGVVVGGISSIVSMMRVVDTTSLNIKCRCSNLGSADTICLGTFHGSHLLFGYYQVKFIAGTKKPEKYVKFSLKK